MATSGSLSLSTHSPKVGESVRGVVTINNPAAGSSVFLLDVKPRLKPTGGSGGTVPALIGKVALSDGFVDSVVATGTGSFVFGLTFKCPSTAGTFGPSAGSFDVDALVTFSDGTQLVVGPLTASVQP